ncbi:hypothetical protein E2C01_068925 [Portunus trituberculatus]|uniref:Uncharacterized protein n=1 Tax=Portunus trituberculatus TaxID=210409 RepID=A0A5B7HTA8_PORTR|nr:hypothetical protein [Portunus trituberculatus]
MPFTSLNNDVITASRYAKFPLRFTGKKLSFCKVLMLYVQEVAMRIQLFNKAELASQFLRIALSVLSRLAPGMPCPCASRPVLLFLPQQ